MIQQRKFARLPKGASKKTLAEVLSVHEKKRLDYLKKLAKDKKLIAL